MSFFTNQHLLLHKRTILTNKFRGIKRTFLNTGIKYRKLSILLRFLFYSKSLLSNDQAN